MCCLCSDRVTESGVSQEVSRWAQIFMNADVPSTVNIAIAQRVVIRIAQSRDAYHTIVEQKCSPEMALTLVSDFIDEGIDYAKTFPAVSADSIDTSEVIRAYRVLALALRSTDIETSNSLSVAWLAMADCKFSEIQSDDEAKEIIASHVMIFNAEKDYQTGSLGLN